ncbi:signal peptidase I [Eubacterium xylanophilum]|uniref:signal peptidase I n=1 Tax=Eubacterium xylanophilum TaxID=39497 RepID=UPI0004B0B6B9|nr:signal peptidase I [Eubacterium xylanophilum]MCR5796964.1 signal peptidase I [Eubacterium sp.]
MNLNYEEEIKARRRRRILKSIMSWSIMIIVVVALAYFVVRFCLIRTSTIGAAMENTLYNGEDVLINTKAYLVLSPSRNDIIAFYDEGSSSVGDKESLIIFRRIIGLPGEKIKINNGKIYINDKEYKEEYEFPELTTGGVAEDEITIGDDEYFVLCDSRTDIEDSRNASFGMVKKGRIVGRVIFKIKPFSLVKGPVKEGTAETAK